MAAMATSSLLEKNPPGFTRLSFGNFFIIYTSQAQPGLRNVNVKSGLCWVPELLQSCPDAKPVFSHRLASGRCLTEMETFALA